MPLVIPNTTATAAEEKLSGVDVLAAGYITIANAPVYMRLYHGAQGQAVPQDEAYYPPGTYPIIGTRKDPIAGIGIRYVDALANPQAQYFGLFSYFDEATIGAGQPFSGTVDASGGFSGGGSTVEVAYNAITASAGAFAAGAGRQTVTSASFTLATVQDLIAQVFAPQQTGTNTSNLIHNLLLDGADIGDIYEANITLGASNYYGMFAQTRLVAVPAGAHTLTWQVRLTGAGTITIVAGAGGAAGVDRPAYLRVITP